MSSQWGNHAHICHSTKQEPRNSVVSPTAICPPLLEHGVNQWFGCACQHKMDRYQLILRMGLGLMMRRRYGAGGGTGAGDGTGAGADVAYPYPYQNSMCIQRTLAKAICLMALSFSTSVCLSFAACQSQS
ncbi:uncharacterized protein LOC111518435 [Drosophila willistoni]|uniref:uncharacterized protein LOC111518435 n=1 Tax=Drosophila willistoni TaxID=7260 RepID=UPI000C26D986|nr:uncharacterized protein LOC111518435 [Drosophila willistoni]